MEKCNECVEIRQTKEPSNEAFIIHCVDSKNHEGKHQAQVWILGDNKATGQKGYYETIFW